VLPARSLQDRYAGRLKRCAEAIAYLSDDGLTPEEEAREFARLGWVVPNGWKISTFARVRQGKEDST